MAEYLFVNNATFSWRATLLQIIALSTTEAKLMALASFCCETVRRKHALELGFPQLKPTDVYEANTGCITLANTCTFVVAISTLLSEYALFSISFWTD